ncbi:MAG: hypothetical protein OEZ38_09350 [Gammaproteobacteria bacterium]|nr:hypothetical protein [Gammaproteobacteria bacterium]
MTNSETIFIIVGIFLLAFGLLFLLFPKKLNSIHEKINQPVGEKNVISIRIGTSKEHSIEKYMNKTCGDQSLTWDTWAYTHPVLTGVVFVLSGFALFLMVLIAW